MSSKRKQRIIVYGLVTRYGPRSSCQHKGLIVRNKLQGRIGIWARFNENKI